MGFSTPPLQFYTMNYYPLYPGGPVVNGSDRTNLNSNSSFYTASTQYSNPFGVNTVSQNRTNDNYYFSLNANGSLSQKSLSSLNPSTQSYAINSNGSLQQASTSNTTPSSLNAYQNFLKSLAISDYNFADLLNQPSFQLSNVGMGLEVTTDGFGNIDNVRVDPAIQAIAGKAGVIDPSFSFLNRYEALMGALQNLSPAADIVQENTGQKPVSLQASNNDNNPFAQLNTPTLTTGNLNKPAGLNNPFAEKGILGRLKSLQPETAGTKLTGANAEVGGLQPQTVATAKAGFDVRISPQIQNVIAALVQNNQAHQASLNPQQMARAMDGTIPMSPSLPAVSDSRSNGLNGFSTQQGGMGLDGFETATDKKSSGGYIPFQFAGGSNQGFEMGGSAGQQQFAQGQGQNQGKNPQQQQSQGRDPQDPYLLYQPLQYMA